MVHGASASASMMHPHAHMAPEGSGVGFMAFMAFMLVGGAIIALIIYLVRDADGSDTVSSAGAHPVGGAAISGTGGLPGSGASSGASSPSDCGPGSGSGAVASSSSYGSAPELEPRGRPGARVSNKHDARATLYGPDSSYKHVVWPKHSSVSPVYCVSERGACSSQAIPLAMIPAHVTSMDVPDGFALVVKGAPSFTGSGDSSGSSSIRITRGDFERVNPDSALFGPGELAFSRNKDINAMIAQRTPALLFSLVKL